MDPLSELSLPPGFRFYPTDEELLVQYLCRKVAGYQFSLPIIGEINLYNFDPWDLPGKATFGDKEWYFFSPRDRKYPNGSRPNRVAGSGYWKATGTDKIIATEGRRVGIKKALVFYVGKAPKGTKTNWIMHEYRLSLPPRKIGSAKLDDWVLCRIYEKNSSGQNPISGETSSKEHSHGSPWSSSSQFDDMLESLPEINDGIFNLPRVNSLKNIYHDEKLNIQNLTSGNFDWGSLAGFETLPDLVPGSQAQGLISSNTYNDRDIYVPLVMPHMDSFCDKFKSADEVQSGMRTQRFENSGLPSSFASSLDPFRIRYPYPTQTGGLGLRQ